MTSVRRAEKLSQAVLCPRPVPEADLRIFLFHHAGGSHLLFREWPPLFPPNWEVCFVESPGHGRLSALPPQCDASSVASFLLRELLPWMDRRFALFGHSMGALLAYELTRRILDGGLPAPVWLGLSACGGPRPDGALDVPMRHRLSADRLRGVIARIGATPAEVLEDDDFWLLLEPLLRADYQLIETWRDAPADRPLPVPMSVFGGESDPATRPERLAAWRERSDRFLGLRTFPGDHFYFRNSLEPFVGTVVAHVRTALARGEEQREAQ